MKRLFTPWRYDYIVSKKPEACVFCRAFRSTDDGSVLVLFRGKETFVMLNRYPYNNGHLLVAPHEHVSTLDDAPDSALEEMMRVLKASQRILSEVYHPTGFNIGMNLGKTSGAGIPEHLHLHIVPRWDGDSSYMTVVAGTRIIPEELGASFAKLRPRFAELQSSGPV